MLRTKLIASATVCGSVFSVLTTSTSGILATGLKK